MPVIATLVILIGLANILLPFVGPEIGFGMGPDPAWVITESRLVRHVVPGVAIILGGVLMYPRPTVARSLGGVLALVGGAWLIVAPVVLGRVVDDPPPLIDVIRPLTYHYGTGLVIAALAAFGLGLVAGSRRTVTTTVATPSPGQQRDAAEPEHSTQHEPA